MSSAASVRDNLPDRRNGQGAKLLFFPTAAPATVAARPDLEALRGRLTEISGERPAATLTLAVRWVVEAQQRGEIAVWIQTEAGLLHPPDLADAGVDLERLLVVRLPDGNAVARAADFLLRSGGVGLAILDLLTPRGAGRPWTVRPRRNGWMNRLLALAQTHRAGVVCLTATAADEPSLASLVGLRVEPRLVRCAEGGFTLETSVLKDKRAQPHRNYQEVCRGPLGLR